MSCTCSSPRSSLGHTAYHQVGLGSSSPYYLYGAQRRYPYAWHGGPGGVPQSLRSGEARALGISMAESGGVASPAFGRTRLHVLADVPLVRMAGPEPVGGVLDLSQNEKVLLGVGVAALVGVLAWRRRGRRRR